AFTPDRLLLPDYRWQRVSTGLAIAGSVFILLKLAVGMDVLGTASENFDPAVGLWLGLAASLVITVLSALPATAARHRGSAHP
nr:hypothetical protein [Micromonospora sp. DSM 115978]